MKPVKVLKHETHPKMYRLLYDDGVVSEEFYNKTRANDILKHYDEYVMRMEQEGSNPFEKPVSQCLEAHP